MILLQLRTQPLCMIPNIRSERRIHLTEKPLQLMGEVVRITESGGHILDPFCGRGTTIISAVQEGYQATGIEMSDEYAKLAVERVETALKLA